MVFTSQKSAEEEETLSTGYSPTAGQVSIGFNPTQDSNFPTASSDDETAESKEKPARIFLRL